MRIFVLFRSLCLIFFFFFAPSLVAQQLIKDIRVALVWGNSDYRGHNDEWTSLPACKNDDKLETNQSGL